MDADFSERICGTDFVGQILWDSGGRGWAVSG